MKLINDVGALGTFIPDDIITMAAEVLEKSESKASTFYINNFKPSVQQLYLSEEASTIDHGYLEEDKPSINFLVIDQHWLTVLFQPDSKPLITIYDSLATPERKYSVLPLLRKMYRNIGEGDVQYAPITQQGDDPACAAYAVAVAIEILRGRKPEQKQFDCSKMREHLMKILQQKKSLVFPTTGLRCLNCRPWQPVCKQVSTQLPQYRIVNVSFDINSEKTELIGREWKEVQVGKDQEKAQSEKDSHPKTEVGKNQTNNQVLIP